VDVVGGEVMATGHGPQQVQVHVDVVDVVAVAVAVVAQAAATLLLGMILQSTV